MIRAVDGSEEGHTDMGYGETVDFQSPFRHIRERDKIGE